MNDTMQTAFITLRHGIQYLMHHPQENIMYSRNKITKLNDISYQSFFKTDSVDIIKIRNNPTSFTHTEIHTTKDISLTGSPPPQHPTSSTEPS